jgi:hypothetical protein
MRADALALPLDPVREQEILLQIEDALEAMTLDILAGHPPEHEARFGDVRAGLSRS